MITEDLNYNYNKSTGQIAKLKNNKILLYFIDPKGEIVKGLFSYNDVFTDRLIDFGNLFVSVKFAEISRDKIKKILKG